MHGALYLWLLGLPLLGWLAASAAGSPVQAFGLTLPQPMLPERNLTHDLKEVHEALASLKGSLPKGTTLSSLPLPELRQRLLKTLLAGTYQTPLGELRFSPEGDVLQRDFSVARVSMAADGRSGRFVLLP